MAKEKYEPTLTVTKDGIRGVGFDPSKGNVTLTFEEMTYSSAVPEDGEIAFDVKVPKGSTVCACQNDEEVATAEV